MLTVTTHYQSIGLIILWTTDTVWSHHFHSWIHAAIPLYNLLLQLLGNIIFLSKIPPPPPPTHTHVYIHKPTRPMIKKNCCLILIEITHTRTHTWHPAPNIWTYTEIAEWKYITLLTGCRTVLAASSVTLLREKTDNYVIGSEKVLQMMWNWKSWKPLKI